MHQPVKAWKKLLLTLLKSTNWPPLLKTQKLLLITWKKPLKFWKLAWNPVKV